LSDHWQKSVATAPHKVGILATVLFMAPMLRSLQWLGLGVAIALLTAVTETAADAQTMSGLPRRQVSQLPLENSLPLLESPLRSHQAARRTKPSSLPMPTPLKQSDTQAAPILQIDGVLEPGDETYNDTIVYDSHPFEGASGQAVLITATSNDFDTYLILQDNAGNLVAENDDSSDTEINAQIIFVFPETGTYQILVSSAFANPEGSYQLAVTPVPADSLAAREATANYHFTQGSQQLEQSNYDAAIAAFEKSLLVYQETNNRYQEGYVINEIGHVYQELGDYETSLDYFQRSAAISLELSDYESAGYAQYFWGLNTLRLGNYDEALQIFETAIASFDQLEDTPQNHQTALVGRAVLLSAIASAYHFQGDKLNELASQEQAVSLLRELPPNEYFVTQLSYLAQLLGQLGRYEESLAAYQETITASEELELPVRKMVALIGIGHLHGVVTGRQVIVQRTVRAIAPHDDVRSYPAIHANHDRTGIFTKTINLLYLAVDNDRSSRVNDHLSDIRALLRIGDCHRIHTRCQVIQGGGGGTVAPLVIKGAYTAHDDGHRSTVIGVYTKLIGTINNHLQAIRLVDQGHGGRFTVVRIGYGDGIHTC